MFIRRSSLAARYAATKRSLLMVAGAAIAGAAIADSASAQIWSAPGFQDARWRELIGAPTPAHAPPLGTSGTLLPATLYVIYNSDIPYSLNDGSLWAGRGFNSSLTVGGEGFYRTERFLVHAVFQPTVVGSENEPFEIFPSGNPNRSSFASPFHEEPNSLDLPLRFGDVPYRELSFGESTLDITDGPITAGISTASQWWGPGIRNTLVISDNAAGIPRVFVRTAHPIRSRIGDFDGQLFLGTLSESRFFDHISADDYRSINGLLLTYRPRIDTGLTIGFSRVMFRTSKAPFPSPLRALDAVWRWERLVSPGDTERGIVQYADQIFSLFTRWRFPAAASEVYAEWARKEVPRTVHELLVSPEANQAYTLGLQSAHRFVGRDTTYLRGQIEFTDLEQTTIIPARPPTDFYAGQQETQGYTQRGQIVGAAIGPGSSNQFVALDYIAPKWQFGAFAGRTRWENDAMYRQLNPNNARHDVTIYSGVRGSTRFLGTEFGSQITVGRRLNYLFQNFGFNAGENPRSAVDIQNLTVEFQLKPSP